MTILRSHSLQFGSLVSSFQWQEIVLVGIFRWLFIIGFWKQCRIFSWWCGVCNFSLKLFFFFFLLPLKANFNKLFAIWSLMALGFTVLAVGWLVFISNLGVYSSQLEVARNVCHPMSLHKSMSSSSLYSVLIVYYIYPNYFCVFLNCLAYIWILKLWWYAAHNNF